MRGCECRAKTPGAIMRVRLIIATYDDDYAGHLSSFLSSRHADEVEVSVCTTRERLTELLTAHRFDVALLDAGLAESADLRSVRLPLALWSESENAAASEPELKRIGKYRRISTIVADILERLSMISANTCSSDSKKARITVIWSPAGGVGKTTVALACALKRESEGRQPVYLNMEPFSSVPAFFSETGKSISSAFEMLESGEGDVKMLLQSIRRRCGGIAYFTRPDNYDDMNILSPGNTAMLVDACSELADDLIIDMPCACGERERDIFDLADRVLIVTDASSAAQVKISQFATQHNVFERVRMKCALVENKGAVTGITLTDTVISLPFVQSPDASAVYKALSACAL